MRVEVYLYMYIVTSGAGPRAVRTEWGRWSKWWWTTPAPNTGLESHGGASEGLNEEWRQWKTREDQAWILCFVCGSHPWGAAAFHLCSFILLLKCIKCSPVPALIIDRVTYIYKYNVFFLLNYLFNTFQPLYLHKKAFILPGHFHSFNSDPINSGVTSIRLCLF